MKKVAVILLIVMTLLLTACTGKITYVGDSPNVALIIANRGDKGFNDSAVIGLNVSVQKHGTNLTILEHDNKAENFEKAFMDAAKGYNHVIMTSSMMKETLEQHAADYPDVKFLMYDGEVDWTKGDLKNIYCIVFRANEVSYLAGYLAASMSETGKIGFVGGVNNTNINDFAVGFEAGAKHKNPDIQSYLEYAGTFNDPEKGKEIAKAMIDDGVDIIFAAAGAVNLGVLDVVAENDRMMIGVDADQYSLFMAEGKADLAKHILTSATKDIGNVLFQAVDNYTKREVITGETKTLGLAEGGVSLSKNDFYKEMVPQAIQDEIDDLEQKIIKGEIEVPTARKASAK
ncbi:MAG: BMP family ABC transporter substrate-binding protein [Clostridiaceae bacterium]|nr:BMP family ABC transporter substrate-binding protein [Clostridiaceae bacterium]